MTRPPLPGARHPALRPFSAATQAWFDASFQGPTPVQARGWPAIAGGAHSLLLAPTGSGKTLAAFLWALDRIGQLRDADRRGYRVVYVSPLKALVYDVDRNLRTPLVGVHQAAGHLGAALHTTRVDVRTGDTPQRERQRMLRNPGDVLVTTPESLYLMLGSKVRQHFATVEAVIVDEIHALAGSKRGAHLALSLERLAALAERDPQRIGLSATARPVEVVSRFLGGDRPVEVVDTREAPHLTVQVVLPEAPDDPPDAQPTPSQPAPSKPASPDPDAHLFSQPKPRRAWPALAPRLLPKILAHRTTIVFVNSRGAAERMVQQLHELHGEPLALAHHGSLSHGRRADIEDRLKSGTVRAIVATSSLELGVDMGAVDQVILIGSPGRVASGLQRVGRAGHGVGEISHGLLIPRHPRDMVECAVVGQLMLEGGIEPVAPPRNPLDVLAQQVVAMVAVADRPVAELAALVRRADGFRQLSDAQLDGLLDMVSGRYPSTDFAELRPLVDWDRGQDLLTARKGAKMLAATHGGTIPDRGLFGVHVVRGSESGPRVGELDEEMVFEARAGQTFILGASTWRIEDITHDRVLVSPAPGEPGTLPFWHGGGPGRPLELGRRLGVFAREVAQRGPERARAWVTQHTPTHPDIAAQIVDLLHEQKAATGVVPSDTTVVVERFADELGDLRVCIHSPFGSRVHAPWAMALEEQLTRESGVGVRSMWSDDGIVLTLADVDEDPWRDTPERWTPDPDLVEDLIIERLGDTALFSGQFRENASRALLLLRKRPERRAPLWAQRLRAQRLLAAAKEHAGFPIVLETYRACLQDVFDLHALRSLLRAVSQREVRVEVVDTDAASPFARAMAFEFVANWLYEGDAPVAERRAQALTLDREMLRDLLGHAELRDLLDAAAIDAVEAELQGVAEGFQARDAGGLLDLLRRVGDLSDDEVRARCDGDPTPWLATLNQRVDAVQIRVAGEMRWIAAADAARYRDALGVSLPPGLPSAFLEPASDPMADLVKRYGRRRGPFTRAQLGQRYGVPQGQLVALLQLLSRPGAGHAGGPSLVEGEFRPGGVEREWCDDGVLRRIRRRTLAHLRATIAPAAQERFARFLPAWQGLHPAGYGGRRPGLDEVLTQLEGAPLVVSELEQRLLPARVRGYRPEALDQRFATGEWLWVGHSAIGQRDGRVQLFRRERLDALWRAPDVDTVLADWPDDDALQRRIVAHLRHFGASFLFELRGALADAAMPDVLSALWDLVWRGVVSNDTVAPLRGLQATGRRRGRKAQARLSGGRWSLLRNLGAPEPTAQLLAWAHVLLARHGVLARESLAMEAAPGGHSALRPVLRGMDERGKVRRGYFVEGLTGTQVGLGGAVDRLRDEREDQPRGAPSSGHRGGPRIIALPVVDPAQPYGRMLAWPEPGPGATAPRVVPGSTVVLVDGAPFFVLTARSGRLRTLGPGRQCEEPELVERALSALLAAHGVGRITVQRVDGTPVRRSALAASLRAVGFEEDVKGLSLRRL